MLQSILQFLGGLVLLLVGGRLLVAASVDAARRLRVSPLIVGLTLVAWGTSAPELALGLISAFKDRSDLTLGNVVGANICNMAFVLGACAILRPLDVEQRLIRVEIWLNLAILAFLAALGLTRSLHAWGAAVMLAAFAAYSAWTILAAWKQSRANHAAQHALDDPTLAKQPMSWLLIAASFAGGLALLSYGGSLASDGASAFAIALGVSPAVVGVTIVSIGTTLPELVTSLLAVKNRQTDLAMGNAIGSCLFNAGAILGLTGLISPPHNDPALAIPLAYMALLAIALVPISRTHARTVSRLEGALLLASYAAFLALSALTTPRA